MLLRDVAGPGRPTEMMAIVRDPFGLSLGLVEPVTAPPRA